jgi:DNA-binding MurR/RpiR family transcriptional regulator
MARTAGGKVRPPETFEELLQQITDRYDSLSGQLQRIAHFVVDHPDDLALETITRLAARASVQPSSMVRFAQALGFDGFSTMQRLFRTRLIEGSLSYRERIKGLTEQHGGEAGGPGSILAEFVDQGIASLEMLRAHTPPQAIAEAISLLSGAEEIHLIAQRRSFPVAFYLAYALARLEKRCHLIDGVGGLMAQQARLATPRDVLVAVSFRTYSLDVIEAVAERVAAGVPVIAITDSPLSPLAAKATLCFEIADPESPAFRSLVAPMCLAQSLVVGLGAHLEAQTPKAKGRRKHG